MSIIDSYMRKGSALDEAFDVNAGKPGLGPNARGAAPVSATGEQPGAQAPPLPPATQASSEVMNQVMGVPRKRQIVNPIPYEGLEAAKRRLGSRSIAERQEELRAYEPGVAETVYNEGIRQVAGGVIEAARETSDFANEMFAALNDMVGDPGGPVFEGFSVDEQGKLGLNMRWGTGEEFYGAEGPDIIRALTPDIPEPETTGGGIVKGISQFFAGWLGVGKVKGLKSVVKTIESDTLKDKFLRGSLRGAVVDATAFDPRDANGSDALNALLEDYPMLQNPVTEYLESDPNDTFAEARFKKVLEGLALGTAAEGLFQAVRFMKARGTNWNTKRKLRKAGVDQDEPLTEADIERNAELDRLEEEQAAEQAARDEQPIDIDETVGEDLDARLRDAGDRDPRAARREGRTRVTQAVMDKYGVSQIEAEEWIDSKLREAALPRLQALSQEAADAGRPADIDLVEKTYRKILNQLRDGSTPEQNKMPRYPILKRIRDSGGIRKYVEREGEWVLSELYKRFRELDFTDKQMPGLFFDPRKNPGRKGRGITEIDQIPDVVEDEAIPDFFDMEGADDYGRPDAEGVWNTVADEVAGNPRRTQEELEVITNAELEREILARALDDAGIDISSATNREAAEALARRESEQLAREGGPGAEFAGDDRLVATVQDKSFGPRPWTEAGSHPERPELSASPGRLEDRPGWELNRAQEAELQGVPESVIEALERLPQAGDMGRGMPRPSPEQIEQLKLSGFLDEAGELTAKGKETLDNRLDRFTRGRDAARRGQRIDRGMARDFPLQIGRAYRLAKQAKPRGRPKKPGADEADDLTADELASVSDDILNERRVWDDQRGRLLLDDVRDATEQRVSQEVNERVNRAALELFQAGDVIRDPNRRLFEQLAELIVSRRLPDEALRDILEKYDLDWTDLGALWATDKSRIASQLGALGNLERAIRKGSLSKSMREELELKLKDPNLPAAERAEVEKLLDANILSPEEISLLSKYGSDPTIVNGMSTWRRLENIRRGSMVSQIATSMRNATTQVGEVGMLMLQEIFERAIKKSFQLARMPEKADAIHPVRGFETLANIIGRLRLDEAGNVVAEAGEFGARLLQRDAEGTQVVSDILAVFPKHRDMLTSSFNSDIVSSGGGSGVLNRVEGFVHMLNTFNRFQEHVFRRSAFKAELGRLINKNPVVTPTGKVYTSLDDLIADNMVGAIPTKTMKGAVDHALDVTWAKEYRAEGWAREGARRPGFEKAAANLVGFVNSAPMASWVMPFPRFMANALEWQIDHSPIGLMEAIVSPAGRKKMAQGDYSELAQGMAGTTMLMSAMQLQDSEYATDRWYELKVPAWVRDTLDLEEGSTLDIRAYAPFSGYVFAAHMIKRMQEGLPPPSYTDIAQGILGTNVRAGLGLYVVDNLIEDVSNIFQDMGSEKASAAASSGAFFGNALGNIAASYLVPLNQFYDAYKAFDQWNGSVESSKVRDASGPVGEDGMPLEGFLPNLAAGVTGQVASRIPGFASQVVESEGTYFRRFPEVQLATRSAAPYSYAPLTKLLTGMTFKDPKNALENAVDKYAFSRSDILPSSGNKLWDRIMAQQMGEQIEADRLPEYVASDSFQRMTPENQQKTLRLHLRRARRAAMLASRNMEPELWDKVRQERGDYRERLWRAEGGWSATGEVDELLEHGYE